MIEAQDSDGMEFCEDESVIRVDSRRSLGLKAMAIPEFDLDDETSDDALQPNSSDQNNVVEVRGNDEASDMHEMENLEEEEGLVCSVCQEGRTLQPSELLGLYAYVKKVSVGADQCGQ